MQDKGTIGVEALQALRTWVCPFHREGGNERECG